MPEWKPPSTAAALTPDPAVEEPHNVSASIFACAELRPATQAGIDVVPVAPARATAPPQRSPVVVPLSPETYKVQMTISRETHEKLRRVQDLLRHRVPNGDPAVIFDRALSLLLEDLEHKRLAATDRPRAPREATLGSRQVPASIRREVWARDGGRCAFIGAHGRCGQRGFLEFHHVEPFVLGGATTAANLELRSRAHNVFETADLFGGDSSHSTRSGPDLVERSGVNAAQYPCYHR